MKECIVVSAKVTTNRQKNVLALVDSGTSATLVINQPVSDRKINVKKKSVKWLTQGRIFKTTHSSKKLHWT